MFILSILAGIAIGIACVLYCLAANPIIGAALFALGLLAVRIGQHYLVTGKFQYLGQEGYKIANIFHILAGNMIGIAIVGGICLLTIPQIALVATNIATTKIAVPVITTFGKAIICGYIMSVATKSNTPLWVSALGVFAFVYTGLNHCVADFFYYLISNIYYAPTFLAAVVGNAIGGKVGGY